MPSHSEKQAAFMRAVAHNSKFAQTVGVPQSVGHKYADVDAQAKHAALLHALGGPIGYASGGPIHDGPGGGPQGLGYGNGTQGAPIQPTADTSSPGAHQGYAPTDPNIPSSSGDPVGDTVWGTGSDPGLFGTAEYKTNSNAFQLPGQQQWAQTGMQGGALGQQQSAQGFQQQGEARGQQGQLANMLMQQAQGQGPSVAQQQLNQTTQNNIASAFAMSQGNPNNPAALRNAVNQSGNLNQQAAQQGALLRAQETMNAQGMLGNVLQGQRGQDLQSYGMGNNAALGYYGLGLQADTTQLGANEAQQQLQQKAYQDAAANRSGYGKAAIGAVSGAASAATTPVPHAHGGEIESLVSGGGVPGHAEAKGDSYRNDTVPAVLSPGEVVLPRSVTQAPDAPERAHAFMRAIQESKAPKATFGDVLQSRRKAQHFAFGGEDMDTVPTPGDSASSSFAQDVTGAQSPQVGEYLSGGSPQTYGFESGVATGGNEPSAGTSKDEAIPPALRPYLQAEHTAADDAPPKPGEKKAEGKGEAAKPAEEDYIAKAIAQANAAPLPKLTMGGGGMGGLESDLVKAGKAKSDAEDESAKVAGDYGKAKLATQEELARQIKANAEKRATDAAANDKQWAQAVQDAADSKIDPNHVYASMGTGKRIQGAIALFLGGISQAFTGHNPAQELMDKAIERDIEAQKENLQTKNNRVRFYMEKGHNITEASRLAASDFKDLAAAQLEADSSKFAGPEAQALAKQHRAETAQKTAMDRAQIRAHAGDAQIRALTAQKEQLQIQEMQREARLRPVVEAIGGAAARGKVLPEGARQYMDTKRTVNVPGHGVTYANTEKDRDEVADTQQALHAGLAAVKRLKELSGTTGLGGNDTQLGQLAVVDAQNAYQSILGRSNAPRGEQEKQLEAALSNPTTFFKSSDSIKEQAKALEKILRKHAASVYGARLVGGLDAAKGLISTEDKEE